MACINADNGSFVSPNHKPCLFHEASFHTQTDHATSCVSACGCVCGCVVHFFSLVLLFLLVALAPLVHPSFLPSSSLSSLRIRAGKAWLSLLRVLFSWLVVCCLLPSSFSSFSPFSSFSSFSPQPTMRDLCGKRRMASMAERLTALPKDQLVGIVLQLSQSVQHMKAQVCFGGTMRV